MSKRSCFWKLLLVNVLMNSKAYWNLQKSNIDPRFHQFDQVIKSRLIITTAIHKMNKISMSFIFITFKMEFCISWIVSDYSIQGCAFNVQNSYFMKVIFPMMKKRDTAKVSVNFDISPNEKVKFNGINFHN